MDSPDVQIIVLPRCASCLRSHSMKDLAWNRAGELVCPDRRRSSQPVQTEPGKSSENLLHGIRDRAFNILNANSMH